MSTRTSTNHRPSTAPQPSGRAQTQGAERRRAARRLWTRIGIVLAVAAAVLFFVARSQDDSTAGVDGGPAFAVGGPGPGQAAPPINLASVDGGTWDLGRDGADKTVMLYFQEGIMCQPCWDQMRTIEDNFAAYRELGIDEMVGITVDPLDLLRRKVDDEGLESVVLSDPDVSLGPSYTANQYGMMGTGMYGHTFIVVGPDGQILWRGDYGGAESDYTMYVTNEHLLADLSAGLGDAATT